MPLVFGLLVVFNAVFLAWQFFEQQNHNQGIVVVVAEQEGKTLQLLAERTDLVAMDKEKPISSNTIARVKVNDDLSCYRIGPILDGDMLRQVRAIFEKSGFDIKVSSVSGISDKYWLYIPPLSTVAKAQSVLADLQKSGIDGAVVTDAPYANAISLGTVSSPDKVDATKNRLLALGYRVESKATSTSRDEQWILIKDVGAVGKSQIDRILVGSPQIKRDAIPCR